MTKKKTQTAKKRKATTTYKPPTILDNLLSELDNLDIIELRILEDKTRQHLSNAKKGFNSKTIKMLNPIKKKYESLAKKFKKNIPFEVSDINIKGSIQVGFEDDFSINEKLQLNNLYIDSSSLKFSKKTKENKDLIRILNSIDTSDLLYDSYESFLKTETVQKSINSFNKERDSLIKELRKINKEVGIQESILYEHVFPYY